MGDLEPAILDIVTKIKASAGDATAANQATIIAKTDNLPADPADESLIEAAIADLISRAKGLDEIYDDVGTVDAIVDRILTATEVRQSAVNDAGATTTKFISTLTETQNDFWNRAAVLFTSGNNDGQMRRIKDYNGATKEITVQSPFDAAPADGDTFILPTVRAFLTPDIEDIADAVLDELLADHVVAGSLSKGVSDILTDLANGTDGLGALKSLIDTVDGLHDVPTADVATNAHARDVVGNKSDAAVTTVGTTKTLMAYLKGLVNSLATVSGYHTVPVKDAATDAQMRDVIGKKDDDAQTAVGTARSIIAYVKGLLNSVATVSGYHTVPVKDAATDAQMRDVVGKKDDDAQTTVGTARSIIAYVKGVLNQVATVIAKTDLMNSASGTSTLSDANVSDTIVPSSLPTEMHVIFDISTIIVAADDFTLEVKVGASGSERVVAYYKITSDGTDTTIDTGSGTGAVVKQRRIDISDVLVYTGEQVLLNYTKSSVTDRNVAYKYICGV